MPPASDRFDITRIRALITETGGNIALITRRAQIPPSAFEKWLTTQPAIKAEIDAARRKAIDSQIFEPDPDELRQLFLALDGQIQRVAAHYGVDRKTIRNWLDKHPDIADLARDVRLALVTQTRSSLFDPDPELVITAIAQLNGNLAAVARQFHVTRGTIQNFVNRHPEAQVALYDANESMLDMAESSLFRAVLAGEAWGVCFYLKTQGRKRGYIERGESFNLNLNLNNLTIDQLERLASGEHPALVLGSDRAEARTRGPEPYPAATQSAGDPGPQEEAS